MCEFQTNFIARAVFFVLRVIMTIAVIVVIHFIGQVLCIKEQLDIFVKIHMTAQINKHLIIGI